METDRGPRQTGIWRPTARTNREPVSVAQPPFPSATYVIGNFVALLAQLCPFLTLHGSLLGSVDGRLLVSLMQSRMRSLFSTHRRMA